MGIDGDRAWVALADSGQVVEVDLTTGRVLRTFDVGGGAGHLQVAADRVYAGGTGSSIASIGRVSGTLEELSTGPVEGLAADGQHLWALEKSGRIVKLNGSDGVSLGDASITIDSDAHANVVAGANKAWASGDRTAVSRLGGPATEVEAEIETGGGIPFTFADGMVWGARPDRLWAIDPATDELTRDVALTGLMEILALDVDGDTAWIAARRPGYVGVVRRLDLETGSTSDAAISLPAGVAIAGDGAAWFSSYETNELVGYDAH